MGKIYKKHLTKLCGRKEKDCEHCRMTTDAINQHLHRFECIGGKIDCPYIRLYDGEKQIVFNNIPRGYGKTTSLIIEQLKYLFKVSKDENR